ncbi:hypothetical protein BTO01_24195 [Vibrio jasicida]|uniref:hypothetical protein n=1 Tax=Vibrio jasicida TaxID=766224 RepID=UPI000CF511AB|nr:hypothetical protein [Vibrio jasicida]PQJ50470.1 hypothetical protein BTO01_24195 [Vibrio jasicida]
MKYKLGLREIIDSDIGYDCPFTPNPEDYSMYVNAFVEDIDSLDFVESAYEENNSIIIELAPGATIEQLGESSKPIHQKYWEQLRTTGFVKIA